MSHFSVVACLDDKDGLLARAVTVAGDGFGGAVRSAVGHRLEGVLAPYDENLEVEAYRDYEEGEPSDYWLYRSLKRAAENERNGTGVLPYKPDALGWGTDFSKETPGEQRVKIAKEAALFRSLPEPVTWEALIDMGGILYPEDDDRLLVDDDGRAYRMSTSNPDSKWDYWRIGGRWGAYFPFRAECSGEVIGAERGWDSPEEMAPLHCDGGPKRALDLTAKREDAAVKGRKTYAEYQSVVDGLPEALPWSSFTARIDAGGYTIQQARADYHAQPRVQAVQHSDFRYRDDVIAECAVDVSLYAERERARAVPGFAVVTLEGKWMAPGRMGWFAATDATDSTRIGYWEAANAYIDALPEDTYLIAVDCHV